MNRMNELNKRVKISRIREKIEREDYLLRRISKGEIDDIEKFDKKIKNVVRVYLSSTFQDFIEERDYLMDQVFPLIKNYCFENYNLDFYVVDMYWGTVDQVLKTNKFHDICLKEINDCKSTSLGPCFLSLLGHKYGTCFLPASISENEFNLINQEFQDNESLANENTFIIRRTKIDDLLNYSYKLDKNEQPICYRLLEKDILIPGFEVDSKATVDVWDELEKKLLKLIRIAADDLFMAKKFRDFEYQTYFSSVTEAEIEAGILTDTSTKSLAIFREIQNIERHVIEEDALASKFIDMNDDNTIDCSSSSLLNELKSKILSALPEKNIKKFPVKWVKDKGIEKDEIYLEKFGKLVYENLILLIDESVSVQNFELTYHELINELLMHAKICNKMIENYQSRDSFQEIINNYVISDNMFPFVLFGEYGSGKTSLIAQLITNVSNENSFFTVVYRFLGSTRETTDFTSTFKSINKQLEKLFNIKQTRHSINNKYDLKERMIEILFEIRKKDPEQTILIILDSVEEILEDFSELQMFLNILPDNSKMILTTVNNPLLSGEVKLDKKNFVELKPLEIRNSISFIEKMLKKSNRELTENQWFSIKKLFVQPETILTPLYIDMILNIVKKWPSYFNPAENDFQKCSTTQDCIRYVFNSCEKLYGKFLFYRLVFYLTIFEYGVSESELEDILSIDDELLTSISEQKYLKIRRFPVTFWSRIKYELEHFLTKRDFDDIQVVSWYHETFYEVAANLYIQQGSKTRKPNDDLIKNVIDYYVETWRHTPKEFKLNLKRKNVSDCDKVMATIRKTKSQQIRFMIKNSKKICFNKRKLNELPNFILKLDDIEKKLEFFKDFVLFNYDFMSAKVKLKSLSFLNPFYDLLLAIFEEHVESGSPEPQTLVNDLLVILYVFLLNQSQFEQYPDALLLHLTSRLEQYSITSSNIASFLDKYKRNINNTTLMASYSFLPLDNQSKTTVSFQKTSINRLIYCLEQPFVFLLTNYNLILINYRNENRLGMLNLKNVLNNEGSMGGKKNENLDFSISSTESGNNVRKGSNGALYSSEDEDLSRLDENNLIDFKIRIAFKCKPDTINTNISELDGFILIFHSKRIRCINFSMNLLFDYECKTEVENVLIISTKHILLVFEKSLKIIDINTKLKVHESQFESAIDTIDSNLNSYIVYLPEYTNTFDPIICLTLINGNIEVFKYIRETMVLCLLCVIPSNRFSILAIKIDENYFIENLYKNRQLQTDLTSSFKSSNSKFETTVLKFAMLFSNGKIFIYTIDAFGINYSYKCDQITLPAKIRNSLTNSADIIDFRGKTMFFNNGTLEPTLDISNKFFIYNIETNKIAKIDQNHSYAKILSDHTFMTFNRQEDMMSIWQIGKHHESSRSLKVIELDSFSYTNSVSDRSGILFEDGKLIYPSYSSIHKINLNLICGSLNISKEKPTEKYDVSVDLKSIDDYHLIVTTKKREVGVLDLKTGSIAQMIGKSSFKNLDTIECTENICILINQEHSSTNEKFVYLTMNIYIKPNKTESYFAEAFKIIGGDTYKIRFFNNLNNKTQKFLIQTYNIATNEVQIYCFSYNEKTCDWIDSITKITMPSKTVALQYSKFKLVFGNTYLRNFIIMFNIDCELSVIDYEKNQKLLQKQFELSSLIKDENLAEVLLDVTEVENTDDFLITFKKRCLTRLNHGLLSAFQTVGSALYVELLITENGRNAHANSWSIEGDSYQIKKNIFCVQMNKKQCFKFFDLNTCKEKKAFIDSISVISFNDKSLLYGLSPDCKFFYTFEYENEFNFYEMATSNRILSVPVHHPVYSFNLTNKFLTMVLDNGVLFSYEIISKSEKFENTRDIDETLQSFDDALDIFTFENNLESKRSVDKYNMDLFETPNRNSIMQLLESPTDAEIKFRRFIESKQKKIQETNLVDCEDYFGSNSIEKYKKSIPTIEINGEKSVDLEIIGPNNNCCDGVSRVVKNAFNKLLSTFSNNKSKNEIKLEID